MPKIEEHMIKRKDEMLVPSCLGLRSLQQKFAKICLASALSA
jgi:hypothetical protein